MHSEDKKTYFLRGKVYAKTFNFGLAIKDYEKVIEIDPNDVEAYVRLG